MKKLVIAIIALLLGVNPATRADEGMWIPLLINKNIAEMQEMGFKLTAEDIYNVNHSSIKDAIIIFGGGCTGEIVSPEGLLLTNHHCGYGSIQKLSTPEDNYLDDGFWAMNKDKEIPVPGLTVRFLDHMKDASKKVLYGTKSDMSEEDRNKIIKDNIKAVEENVIGKDSHLTARVVSFFGGNEYYLFVYETFRDVRFVGAPPESIGKFGADTDNWMWPRHTGDFSMFRIYTAPDGKPATYSKENVPLKSKHYLPINIAGVEQDDFAMIMGYPGGTKRFLSSFGVDLAINSFNPTFVDIREVKLAKMREGMDADADVRLQYASKFAGTANYWKYFIGQTKGLKRLKVKEKKQKEEAEFQNWIDQNPKAKMKYGEALVLIGDAYDVKGQYDIANVYFREAVYRGAEILGYAYRFSSLSKLLNDKESTDSAINIAINRLKARVDGQFKNYNEAIDRNLFASMMEMYHKNVPLDQQPPYLLKMVKKFKGNYNKYADYMYGKSIFASKEKVEAFLNAPNKKKLSKDPAMIAVKAFSVSYRAMQSNLKEANEKLAKGHRLYIAGVREMNPDNNYAPDANFTMRLSYGSVQDYYPADAIHYEYFTTMDGIMQKEDPDNWEFIVPAKLKELYQEKDFGQYGKEGVMNVCFLTNHDITGGNSGSPVINANGELIGLVFDGNWEAMSGDIAFEPELQRTINVDIRYVMFIIDKFAGANNLIEEMTIVTEKPVEEPVTEVETVEAPASVEVVE
ncbi:MAG: serine protease [Bacteroidetes bacterium]|nr:serine protease [Bacteroidota bacterium]|tara:strand:- start:1432 stop:3657 length:2226 start_codon:yes stop_codon:yes gene_type:complete